MRNIIQVTAIWTLMMCAIQAFPSEKEMTDLVKRLLPEHVNDFEFIKIPQKDGKNVFSLESKKGKIIISGDNVNSMARGLGTYLRKYCHLSPSWDADAHFKVPDNLPHVPAKESATCSVKNRFFFNYCTFGYTMPFWDWKKWERCIDWMALNGINAPLAITGTEKVLIEVWKNYGFTEGEVLKIFTDPPHLPWYHMNTISHWGGPCPASYVEYGYQMQKKIVARERALGMRPIMMAFNGRVPRELSKKFPDKKVHVLGKGWGMFTEQYYTYFLDPYDPLFADIQKRYIKTVQKLYGSDHLYGVDPFNEIEPPSWEPEYLANTAKKIYSTMAAADKDAVWIQMGWLFFFDKKHWTNERIKALLKAVPENKLVMLDYYCETQEVWKRTEAFFDTPFIWCYLGNFGGKECLAGRLPVIFERLKEVQKKRCGKNLWGIGSTLEGFGVNMMTYEFLFDNVWSDMPSTVETWIRDYAVSRCGEEDRPVIEAWQELQKYVFNKWSSSYNGGSILHARPRFQGTYGFTAPARNFTPKQLMHIWELMMKASEKTTSRDSFRYDLVNIIRQYTGDISKNVREQMRSAYLTGNLKGFIKASDLFLSIAEDQEKIVRSRPEFLLGRWIADAYKISEKKEDREVFERSIRNILTTWGPKNCALTEYANRDWDGLTRDYYMARWKIFIDDVKQAMKSGTEFDKDKFDAKIADFEWNYAVKNRNHYTSVPEGDSWKIAKELFAKYKTLNLDDTKTATPKTVVTKWGKENLTDKWKKFTWDISKYMSRSGLCIVTFDYTGGAHALMMRNVRIKCGEALVAEDIHEGRTGNIDQKNTFKLTIDSLVPAAKYTLEAELKPLCPAGAKINTDGTVTMEIFKTDNR